MKRAEVWKVRNGPTAGMWECGLITRPIPDLFRWADPIAQRIYAVDGAERFPTHTEALAHALHEVGLTPTNPEEEQA